VLAHPGGPERVQVEAVAPDPDREAHGLLGPGLADDARHVGELGRGLERERRGIAPAAERVFGEGLGFAHLGMLLAAHSTGGRAAAMPRPG
jgi:hypothetical protein